MAWLTSSLKWIWQIIGPLVLHRLAELIRDAVAKLFKKKKNDDIANENTKEHKNAVEKGDKDEAGKTAGNLLNGTRGGSDPNRLQ